MWLRQYSQVAHVSRAEMTATDFLESRRGARGSFRRFHPLASTPSELSSSQTSNHHPGPPSYQTSLFGQGARVAVMQTMRACHGTTDQIHRDE